MTSTARLPKPVTEVWDWQKEGLCRGRDSAVFFHPDNERGSARAAREDRAKQLCERCPVLLECRRHALAAQEPYGVWGGMGEDERRRLIAAARRHDERHDERHDDRRHTAA